MTIVERHPKFGRFIAQATGKMPVVPRANANPPAQPAPAPQPPVAQPAQPAPQRPATGGGGGQPPAQPPRGGDGGNQPPRNGSSSSWFGRLGPIETLLVSVGVMIVVTVIAFVGNYWSLEMSNDQMQRHTEIMKQMPERPEDRQKFELERKRLDNQELRIRAYAERQRLAAGVRPEQPVTPPSAIVPPPTLAPSPAVLSTLPQVPIMPTFPSATGNSGGQCVTPPQGQTSSHAPMYLSAGLCLTLPERSGEVWVVFYGVPNFIEGVHQIQAFDQRGNLLAQCSAEGCRDMIHAHIGQTMRVLPIAGHRMVIRTNS